MTTRLLLEGKLQSVEKEITKAGRKLRYRAEVSFTRIDLLVSLLCLNDGVLSSSLSPSQRHRKSHPSRYNDRREVDVDVKTAVDARAPRMVASNENSAASNEFVSSVGGKSSAEAGNERDGEGRTA